MKNSVVICIILCCVKCVNVECECECGRMCDTVVDRVSSWPQNNRECIAIVINNRNIMTNYYD